MDENQHLLRPRVRQTFGRRSSWPLHFAEWCGCGEALGSLQYAPLPYYKPPLCFQFVLLVIFLYQRISKFLFNSLQGVSEDIKLFTCDIRITCLIKMGLMVQGTLCIDYYFSSPLLLCFYL